MLITTINSIKVKPRCRKRRVMVAS